MNYYTIVLINRYTKATVTFDRIQSDTTAGYGAIKAKAMLAEPHEWLILSVALA